MKEKFNKIDCGNYITITNVNGNYHNHCHINKGHKEKQHNTADMLIRLMHSKRIPKSKYLRKCILRVSLDEKYKENVRQKIEKDYNKDNYFNPQKGIRR